MTKTYEGPTRKIPLWMAIDTISPRRILELGACPGRTAVQMIKNVQVQCNRPYDVKYYGFDLFAPMTTQEFDDTPEISIEVIRTMLEATGAEFYLFKGDSKVTLPEFAKTAPPMDLIYIDGGHSYETIASDWEHSKGLMHPGTIAILDDYWDRLDGGCRKVVDGIDRKKYSVEMCGSQEFSGDWRLAPSYVSRTVRVRLVGKPEEAIKVEKVADV